MSHDVTFDLDRPGLSRNELWQAKATAEAEAVFGGVVNLSLFCPSLRIASVLVAISHPYAIDYLRQAPVIALAVSGGDDLSDPRLRKEIVGKLGPIFRKGLRLRDFMNEFALAYPLRWLQAGAFAGSRKDYDTIIRLSNCLSSTALAQIIPRNDFYAQAYWLLALKHWTDRLEERQLCNDVLFRWAARAIAQKLATLQARGSSLAIRCDISTVADFAAERPSMFKECWSFSRAVQEAQSWRRGRMDGFDTDATLAARVGPSRDVSDKASLPNRIIHRGYELVAVRSAEELLADGRAMGHCVASYGWRVFHGQSRIYSIRKGGIRLATLELVRVIRTQSHLCAVNPTQSPSHAFDGPAPKQLEWKWRIRQLVGPANNPVSIELAHAVRAALAPLVTENRPVAPANARRPPCPQLHSGPLTHHRATR
jgi:hypothetical protein